MYFRLLCICCLSAFSYTLFCQPVCNGKVVEPVVHITFGSGQNPGSPLPAGMTTYQYKGADCPDDGYYRIVNSITSCFYGDWHAVMHDHTGDSDGYFMLVNASYGPGDFFLDTVKGLCSNNTYEFSAWLLEIDTPTACSSVGLRLPNITFRVEKTDGTLLQSYNTGDIPASTDPTWVRYGFFFKSAEPTLVLHIINNTAGGCGNDIAMDDITFSACNPVVVTNITTGTARDGTNICFGKDTSINFSASINGGNNLQYQWQSSNDNGKSWANIGGATDTLLTVNFSKNVVPGVYLNRVMVAESPDINIPQCRIMSDSNIVVVRPLPVPSITSNSPLCPGGNLSLSVSGADYYNWTGPNNFTSANKDVAITQVGAPNGGKYFVTASSSFGCAAKDSADVVVNPSPEITVSAGLSICEGTSTQLHATGGGTYKWYPSTGLSGDTLANPFASPADTTKYLLTVTNQFTCTDTASVNINILPKARADAGQPRQLTQGQSITLNGSATGYDISYYWTPDFAIDNPHLLQPVINPLESGTYSLHVVSNAGCGTAVSDVFVTVYKKVEIPNAFSPNRDGINDTWNIIALQTYSTASVSVYGRYGQLVYHCTGYDKQWDGTFNGTALPVGTYYYIIDLKNGTPVKSGSVTILR